MVTVAVLTLPVFYTSYVIARWEGWVFLGLYSGYTVYLILRVTGDASRFAAVMLWVVAIVFAIVVTQSAMQWLSGRNPRKRTDARIE